MEDFLFNGVGVALPTPFHKDLTVDYKSLANLVSLLISQKVDYLVAIGTTAESPTLSEEEKHSICEVIKNETDGRVPLMLGIGSNDTRQLVERIRQTDFDGFSALLSVSPYYNRPTQEGLYRHFAAVAEASPVPVVLYNIPGRTGVNLNAETIGRLAKDFSNIIAIKEASGDIDQLKKLKDYIPEDFRIISGDDGLTVSAMEHGAVGVISVAANVKPKSIKGVVENCRKGKFEDAKEIDGCLKEFYHLLFKEGNPAGIKSALSSLGIMEDTVRLPLVTVSEETSNQIKEYLKK